MDNKSKWIIAGIIAVALVVGLTLGAVAIAFIQRAMWGYPPAYAANNFTPPSQGYQNYTMPGPMMQGAPRWGGGPMMTPPNFRGRGPQGNFGPGMMGRGNFGPGMMGRGGYGPMMGAGPGWGGSLNSLVTIAAEKLDMTATELTTELQAGKTIAGLAQEKDVSLDSIVDAAMASRLERMALMVANGAMTQEQLDAMTEVMQANLTAQLNGEGTPGVCPGLGDSDGDGVCDFGGRGPRGGWGRGMMWR
jgi:hypothetical protein